jgi:ATP-dependent exoDNAse (exonuclease V) beta subunit
MRKARATQPAAAPQYDKPLAARRVDVDFRRAVDDEWRRRLYVACSRARHAVHIVTSTKETELTDALRAFAGTEKTRASWRALSRQLGVRLVEGGNLDPFNEPRVG